MARILGSKSLAASGRARVAVMQPADVRNGDNAAEAGRPNLTRDRCVTVERQVSWGLVIVHEVRGQGPKREGFVEYDDGVQLLVPDADPRVVRSRRRGRSADCRGRDPVAKPQPVAVAAPCVVGSDQRGLSPALLAEHRAVRKSSSALVPTGKPLEQDRTTTWPLALVGTTSHRSQGATTARPAIYWALVLGHNVRMIGASTCCRISRFEYPIRPL